MSRKSEIFENVLTQAYDNGVFTNFVQEFLNNVDLVAPTVYKKVYNNFSYYVDGYYHIGNYTGNDGNKIAVFSVALRKGDSVERARTMQRNFIKPLLQNSMCAGALVAFYTLEEPEKWRLSFIRLDYEFAKGKVMEKLTPARRYSYLVGKGEPCNTAKQRLFPIFNDDNNNPDIDDLEEAFSVEKVTNEFFQQYCEKYHQLREFLESNEDFIQEAQIRNFTSEQFAKKLLGQIVFLYFIQKKGWLGVDAIPVSMTEKEYKNAFFARGQKSRDIVGAVYEQQPNGTYRIVFEKLKDLSDEDEEFLAGIVKGKPWGTGPKDFMRKIFEGCVSVEKNYFDDYLEPLFYTGLNKNRGENGFYPALHRRIPFLNGGLFEQLDNYEWENNNFNIPNSIFSNVDEKGRNADGILDIFDRYNFTMNEDEPMEREVAIDPEMLGKVFENLLDVKDRKSKGAFYTPREIVHYMCQETLINHLTSKTGISEEAIRDFILYGEYLRDEDTVKTLKVVDENGKSHYEIDKNKELLISEEILSFKSGVNRLKELDDLLANVKVADLAVGSGAFPLGMLNEIVKARQVLTEYLAIEMNGFQKKSFYAYERKPYDLKVNTIKNCIFACDIEPSAVDIAKLRLWLSIVIDDEITEDVGNGDFDAHSKPRQLPNLDCNIICGNSLIDEFKGNKLMTESVLLNNVSENSQQTIFQQGVDGMISKLIELQDKLFFAKEHNDKEEIKEEIQKIYDDIVLEQIGGDYELREAYFETQSEASKPFVLWQLYFPKVFRDNGGFDIVIGNPPYIQLQKSISEQGDEKLGDQYQKMEYETFVKTGDIYCLFYEKGNNLLKTGGYLAFITSNKWMRAGYGKNLRNYFATHTNPTVLIDFAGQKIFETATVDVNILIFEKSENKGATKSCIIDRDCKNNLSVFVQQASNYISFQNNESWVILSPLERSIKEKINTYGTPLSKWDIRINYGIKTGLNDAFIISGAKKDELIAEDSKSAEIIRPILRGRDIKRYEYTFADLWVILAKFGSYQYLEEKYPAIYHHLLQYEDKLKNRGQCRYTSSGKANVSKPYPGQHHWLELDNNPRQEYLDDFSKQKIVWGNLCLSSQFALADEGMFVNAPSPMIVPGNKYILAVLNSKLGDWYIRQLGVTRNGGYFEYKPMFVEKLPVPQISAEQQKPFICLAEQLLKSKTDNIANNAIEHELDQLVFDLYGLSANEIEYITKT